MRRSSKLCLEMANRVSQRCRLAPRFLIEDNSHGDQQRVAG